MIYYSPANADVRLNTKTVFISEASAKKLNLIPVSSPCYNFEHWIIINMANDCIRAGRNYAFVKVKAKHGGATELWASSLSLGRRT